MSIARSKKPVKVTAKAIAANRLRRSRSEGTLVHMATTSYPHALLGNATDLISSGNEKAIRRAINTERDLQLLEYIRQVTLNVKEGKVYFSCESVKLEVDMTKAKALEVAHAPCFEYLDSTLHDGSGFIELLLGYFHSVKVRGMTRKFPLDKGQWEIKSTSLKIDKENKGLAGLNLQVETQVVSLKQIKSKLNELISQPEVSLCFGYEQIDVAVGGQTLKIDYKQS